MNAPADVLHRLWFRVHSGRLASVVDSVSKPGWFVAGAPSASDKSPYQEFATLSEAMNHADQVSGCPQPCQCASWQGPV